MAIKVFQELKPRYLNYGNIPVTRVWLNNFRFADKMPKAIVEFVDAPFDIKKTFALFAKEKGLSLFEERKLLTGRNPLDCLQSSEK